MFNWFDRLLVKIAKKILNRYAPKGEFISYINKHEEKILKKLGGYGKPVNETGIKSFFISGVKSWISSKAESVVRAAGNIKGWGSKYQGWFTAISIGIQVISWLSKPKMPDTPDMDNLSEQNAKGILLNKQSANGPIPVIYGKRKVGGTLAFLESSGTTNEYLYMVIALCEGQVESCEKIWVDDKQVTWSGTLTHGTERTVGSGDSNFYKDSDSKITVTWYDGRDDQTYNTTVGALSSWTSNHRLRGISYLALKFKWNEDCFMGIPSVHAEIKGRKVYNANLDGTKTGGSGSHREDTASTWEWSDNPVWCTLDYMRNSRFGLGVANSYFDGDYADWQTASDVCDADVTPYGSASAIDLLDMNYVLDTKKKCIDNLKEMVSGFRGYLNYANGEYKVIAETTGSASISLTEDNIIGGIKVNSLDKNSRYNRVIVTFINPNKNYQSDEAQWPPIDDSGLTSADQHSTMKTADGGFLLEGRFDYPSITSPYQAQEIAEIICRRSRNNLNVSLRCDATGLDLMVGELVNITHATPSFSAKTFRIQGMQISADLSVELQLTEYQASYYTWTAQSQAATIPDTTLPNPFSVAVPASVTLSDELVEYSDGVVLTRLNILVGASTDKFVQYYQVETKKTSESDYKVIAKGTVLNYHQLNVVDGIEYSVRVKAINTMGVSSSYVTATRTIVGATDTPNDVDELSVSMVGSNQMQLSWEPVSDLDVSYYSIRYQDVTSNASWAGSTNLTQVVRRKSNNVTINARTGAFLIKAVDKLGNESDNEKIVYSNISGLEHFTTVATYNEESASAATGQTWIGTFDGACVKGMDSNNDDIATLDTITLFDSTVGNFDSPEGDFDLGGTDITSNPTYYQANIESSGLYTGSTEVSLDAVYDATFQSTIDMIANDLYDLFDSGRGASAFDDAQGPFDGNAGTKCNAYLQVGSSESSLGAITTFSNISQQATIKGRYFKFRLKLTSDDNKVRPEVSKMQMRLALEKRLESGEDVASGAGAKAITYTNAFYASPAVGIAAQNMATGDYYAITSKTKTGFTITFYNSSAAAQNRTFDYVAKGYGLKS